MSGIEIAMISVLRQLPRNSRIVKAVRLAAMGKMTDAEVARIGKVFGDPSLAIYTQLHSAMSCFAARCMPSMSSPHRRFHII